MKKSLLTTAALALGISFSTVSNAQLANGSIAPDFTLTDINGNSHHLYAYLNAGKTVFIDCSAAWCSPCWAYHQSGALDNLYTQYGPPGTDELMVLYIEGEHTNTTAQITGTTSGTAHSTFSQGDWTAGTTFPIIDDPSTGSTFLSDYAIGYFPTIYMICPDKVVREVGQLTTANLYAAKQATCVMATAANDASLMNSVPTTIMSCDSVNPTFKLTNESNTTLTSATITYDVDGVFQKTYNWTGSLATYAMINVTGIKLGAGPGTHTITATVSNPNGTTDAAAINDAATNEFTIFNPIGGTPVTEDFETVAPPASWLIQNGGSADTWLPASYGGFGTSSQSVTLDFYNIAQGEVDGMILPPQTFAGQTTASLTFDVANARYSTAYSDKLKVKVSTNCGLSWTTVYSKAGATLATAPTTTNEFFPTATQWRTETVSLNAYAGQANVLVMFEGTSDYGNDLYVDNVNITFPTGINEVNNISNVSLYPNPTSSQANLEVSLTKSESVTINVYNSLGEIVYSEARNNMPVGDNRIILSTESLANGVYNVSIASKSGFVTRRLTVSK
ncbi:MAG: T9SS type A sorting domain-containing protein [Bacteroidia bacterium]